MCTSFTLSIKPERRIERNSEADNGLKRSGHKQESSSALSWAAGKLPEIRKIKRPSNYHCTHERSHESSHQPLNAQMHTSYMCTLCAFFFCIQMCSTGTHRTVHTEVIFIYIFTGYHSYETIPLSSTRFYSFVFNLSLEFRIRNPKELTDQTRSDSRQWVHFRRQTHTVQLILWSTLPPSGKKE